MENVITPMKIIWSIFIIVLLVSCKPSPTYNPFDNVFDVDIDELLDKGWSRPLGTNCGYANINEPTGKLRLYYQVYDGDLKFITNTHWINPPVVAKGFTYHLDTLSKSEIEQKLIFNKRDSLKTISFDTVELNLHLSRFGYHVKSSNNGSILITNDKNGDSIELEFLIDYYNNGLTVRTINFFKGTNGS